MEKSTKSTSSDAESKRVLYPFWLKLSCFSISLTGIVLFGVFYFIYHEIEEDTREQLIEEINQTDHIRTLIEERRKEYFSQIANEMKYNSILVSFIRDSASTSDEDLFGGFSDDTESNQKLKENSEKILSTLKNNYHIFDSSSIFILINRNNEILLNKNQSHNIGTKVDHWDLVKQTLQGQSATTHWWQGKEWKDYLPSNAENKLYGVDAFPLKDQQGIYGIMIIGIELGHTYFKQFQFDQNASSTLSFIENGKILSSQLSEEQLGELQKHLQKSHSKQHLHNHDYSTLKLGDDEYLSKSTKIQNGKGFQRSLLLLENFSIPFNHKVGQFKTVIVQLIVIAGIITLTTSILFSRFLTKSIKALTDGVHRIGQGDFDARVHVKTRDEMGILASSFNEMGEDLKKGEFIEGAMKKYVSSHLVDQLKEEQAPIKLGGQKQSLSIFFSDVANFTTISEHTSPEQLIDWLNQYMSVMSEIIQEHHGTIDKYIGDAIMAFWNAPKAIENHAEYAAQAALKQIRFLHSTQAKNWEKQLQYPVVSRIGMHYGEAVVGNVGSERRISYTAIGDAINLASRLESANKFYGTNILISEDFQKQLNSQYITRPIDKIIVKGKTEPVKVFELIGTQDDCGPQTLSYSQDFTQMMQCYWNQDFDEALKMLKSFGGKDPIVQTYIERCLQYQSSAPGENWQGVTVLQGK